MDEQLTWSFHPLALTLNCICTFALNLSVFLVISHTSALTIRVAGVVKDWVVVLLSALLFADTKLTLINLSGYAIGNFLTILSDAKEHVTSTILLISSHFPCIHSTSLRCAALQNVHHPLLWLIFCAWYG